MRPFEKALLVVLAVAVAVWAAPTVTDVARDGWDATAGTAARDKPEPKGKPGIEIERDAERQFIARQRNPAIRRFTKICRQQRVLPKVHERCLRDLANYKRETQWLVDEGYADYPWAEEGQ